MKSFHTILIPTDFSDHAEKSLYYGASLGERFGATLHLLHVVTLHGYEGESDESHFPDMTQMLQRADQIARDHLDKGADHGGEPEVNVVKSITRSLNASEAIVDYANRKKADLIVISTKGKTGLSHVLMGSVAERVIRYSPCPVLIVRSGDQDFVDPDTGKVNIGKVVVADDFSDGPKRALERSIDFMMPYSPEIHFFHSVENEIPPVYALAGVESVFQINPDLKEKLSEMLEKRAHELVPRGLETTCVIGEGKPHRSVGEYAKQISADLMIVAAESKIDLSERLLGGTTERIVRFSPCPTLVL